MAKLGDFSFVAAAVETTVAKIWVVVILKAKNENNENLIIFLVFSLHIIFFFYICVWVLELKIDINFFCYRLLILHLSNLK